MKSYQMNSGSGNKRGEATQEIKRIKDNMSGSIAIGCFQSVDDLRREQSNKSIEKKPLYFSYTQAMISLAERLYEGNGIPQDKPAAAHWFTATLAAFIGAGGLGDPIFRGIAILDSRLIFLGAVPACLLALVLDATVAFIENLVISKGLKLEKNIKNIELK